MGWFKDHWKALLQAGCAATAAVAIVVPAVAPAAVICAVAVPTITSAKSWKDALKGVTDILAGTSKK